MSMNGTRTDGSKIVNDVLADVHVGNQTLIDIAKRLVGDKESIQFTIENREMQPEPPELPPRKESPRRAHLFHDACGFAAYLAKYKTDNTVVIVDIAKQEAFAVIDEKARFGFETIVMQPIVHPLFEPWKRLLLTGSEEYIPLRTFANFLSINRRCIVEPNGKELVHLLSQIGASRKTTIQRGFGNHSINGIVCELNIQGTTKNESVELPDIIKIEVPLYLARPQVTIEVDLMLGTDETDVLVECHSADLIQRQVDLFDDILREIYTIEDIVVALGRPEYSNWEYLKD